MLAYFLDADRPRIECHAVGRLSIADGAHRVAKHGGILRAEAQKIRVAGRAVRRTSDWTLRMLDAMAVLLHSCGTCGQVPSSWSGAWRLYAARCRVHSTLLLEMVGPALVAGLYLFCVLTALMVVRPAREALGMQRGIEVMRKRMIELVEALP